MKNSGQLMGRMYCSNLKGFEKTPTEHTTRPYYPTRRLRIQAHISGLAQKAGWPTTWGSVRPLIRLYAQLDAQALALALVRWAE